VVKEFRFTQLRRAALRGNPDLANRCERGEKMQVLNVRRGIVQTFSWVKEFARIVGILLQAPELRVGYLGPSIFNTCFRIRGGRRNERLEPHPRFARPHCLPMVSWLTSALVMVLRGNSKLGAIARQTAPLGACNGDMSLFWLLLMLLLIVLFA